MNTAKLYGNWNYPTQVCFGEGRVRELPELCGQLSMYKPLIVTDPYMASLPLITELRQLCAGDGIELGLFSEVKSNPSDINVAAGVNHYRQRGHDGIIALGGGSALDAGKAIALMVGQNRPLWDFEDAGDNYKRANTESIAKIIAIPTTAGTGSEVGRASVIVDTVACNKRLIFHPLMLPSVVISDPELCLSLPPHLTAATGMDALAHNMEAYFAPGFHPLADGIALEGCRLIKQYLPTAVKEGNNIEARAHLLAAATMGATAFQKGLGVIHSLSHPVGAIYDVHHGLLNAILMPYALIYNRKFIEDKCCHLARLLDLPNPSFESLLDWVLAFCQKLDIPLSLHDIGIDHSDIDTVVRLALADPSTASNPRPMNFSELKVMYGNAIDGRL